MKIVILAGGVGQRLWPLSKIAAPKQVQPFFGKDTLLQKTVKRIQRGFAAKDIYIVTGENFAAAAARQLPGFPKSHILNEPARRDTTAAIGLAAYTIARDDPEEVMVSIASDHFIKDEAKFIRALRAMDQVVRQHPKAVCLMGIEPRHAETGYGYIEMGRPAGSFGGFAVRRAVRFVEKPQLKAAQQMVSSGKYLWNPSYFGWRVDRVQELYQQFIPETDRLLRRVVAGDKKAFLKLDKIAIDYAIMEKLRDDFYVIPVDFYWTDIGHWASVREVQAKHELETVGKGLHHALDTKGSLIYNYSADRALAAVGVEDLLIVQTDHGTLVCRRDRAQDVKKLVEEMKKKKHLKRFL